MKPITVFFHDTALFRCRSCQMMFLRLMSIQLRWIILLSKGTTLKIPRKITVALKDIKTLCNEYN